MTTKENLVHAVKNATDALSAAEKALADFEASPENNIFDSLEIAEEVLEDRLLSIAHSDCEGSYNCGMDTYTQEFIVDGSRYIAQLAVEYNRHDKTYYYIEESDFTVSPVAEVAA